MTPAAIIREAMADGLTLALTPAGTIKATGDGEAVKRWHAILSDHKPGILASLRQAANSARHWRVCYPDAAPMEILFTPARTRAEVASEYPGAVIEQLPDPIPRNATPAEAAELRKLVARVLADADDADRAEALAVALVDPEAALTSFRLLADEARKRAIWGV